MAALALYLVPMGIDKNNFFNDSGLRACVQAGQDCPDLRFRLLGDYDTVNNIIVWFNFVPGIVGLLLAAPIVLEFEQRTYRLAWTQSVTRERWLTMKLAVAIAGVVAFAALLTLLATWSFAPYDQSEILVGKNLGQSYDFEGAMPLSYTFFAFALTLAVGAVSRRASVAVAVGLIGYVVLRVVMMELLRQGLSSEINVGPGESLADRTRDMNLFWSTQAKEAAIFLSSALGLLAVTVWHVRRQMS
jgi:hypothetical protein